MDVVNSSTMPDSEEIAFDRLEVCNYRHLQVLAKQMGLPSNVKKVQLIEMIRAKKYCSEIDLQMIIERIKTERKVIGQIKKNKKKQKARPQCQFQLHEVSSTSQSPPITLTPKRPSEYVVEYTPDISQAIMKYQPQNTVVQAGAPYLQLMKRGNDSDRVLRSFNSLKRPNYRIMDQSDCVIDVVKSRNTIKEIRQERVQEIRQERIQEIRQERAYQSVNLTIQKQRPILNTLMLNSDRQLVPMISRSINTGPKPANRQRKVSGIYPLEPQEKPHYKYIPTVNLRQTDGRVTKINAVIQRPLANTLLPKNHTFLQKRSLIRRNAITNAKPIVVTVQDVINYKVDHPSIDLTSQRAIEAKVYETEQSDQYNATNSQTLQRNVFNNQIEPASKSRQIEHPLCHNQSNRVSDQPEHDPNALRLSYQGRTLVNIIPEQTERVKNRKIYKNRSTTTSNPRKGWIYKTNQEPEVETKKEWIIYDINDQSLDNTGNHKAQKYKGRGCVSTNKVVQRRPTVSVARDLRFGQEIRDRNMEHARNADRVRNKVYARNVDHARDMKLATNVGQAEVVDQPRNMVYSRNVDHATDLDLARNVQQAEVVYQPRNMVYARNVDHARDMDLARNIDQAGVDHQPRYMVYARNVDHARTTDHDRNYDSAGVVDHSRNIDLARNDRVLLGRDTESTCSADYTMNDHVRDMDTDSDTKADFTAYHPSSNTTNDRHLDMDLARNVDQAVVDHPKNMVYARNVDQAVVDHPRNMVYARNMEHARNLDHARNMNARSADLRKAIEPARMDIDPRTHYPNMSSLTDVIPNEYCQEANSLRNCSVFYHKIRAESARPAERLPRFNDAFSQFNDVAFNKLCQPLYVKVSEESEKVPLAMHVNSVNNTCMLENVYNFKSQFLTNPPLLQIAVTKTHCTFSTKTVTTAVAQSTGSELSHNNNSFERVNSCQFEEGYPARFYDYPRLEERRPDLACDEVYCSPPLEAPAAQAPGAVVAAPDMVEDALELISQDGDYMERIGMDVRVQCILCSAWAGPKFILEYHLKNEHCQDIQPVEGADWCVQFTLGSLTSRATWGSRLLQHLDTLYAVSAKYFEDTILLAVSAIPDELEIPRRGRITVYNRRSGKPYSFEGDITHIPDSMPYEYGRDCLVLDVSSLDLIPNSANLRLVNRELVGSPNRVVVGQPELNNVEIVVHIKLLD